MRRLATVLVLATIFLSGCATVQSETKSFEKAQRGFTYFLPTRFVKLTATKEMLDSPRIRAALEAKTKELDAAKVVAATADQKVKDKTELIAALAPGATEARAAATQALQVAQAEALIAAAQRDGIIGTVNGLKSLYQSSQTQPEGSCGYTAKLELLAPQGDPNARFVANPTHNPMRDDTTKLVVTADGLLSSANVVAADRTGDIIVEIAGALGSVLSPGRGLMTMSVRPREQLDCNKAKKMIAIFDPAARSYVDVNSQLSNADYPLQLERQEAVDATPVSAAAGRTDAIFYRSPVPVRIRISECISKVDSAKKDTADEATDEEAIVKNVIAKECTAIEEVLLSVPQAGPISYIPQRSSAFVKTVNDVQFENGMIKSWSADRPSEVLEIVRLPVRILTALISVPATMLQLRVNHDSQAKSLAETQAAEMAASVKLRILQVCLDAAGEDVAAARSCLSK